MTKVHHASEILYDFFGEQKTVYLTESEDRLGPTYVVFDNNAEIRFINDMTRPEPHDVRVAAHEIGQFVTAPLHRLHLTDYGFKNSTGVWTYAMWNAEFEVLARQVCILRGVKRFGQVKSLFDDMPMFLRRSGEMYLRDKIDYQKAISTAYEGQKHAILQDYIREDVEHRILKIPGGYVGIVEEFRQRCTDLAQNFLVAA